MGPEDQLSLRTETIELKPRSKMISYTGTQFLFIILVLIIVTLPIFPNIGSYITISNLYITDIIILFCVPFALIIFTAKGLRISSFESKIFILLIIYIFLFYFSILGSWDTEFSLRNWKGIIGRSLFVFLIVSVVRNINRFRIICNSIMLGAIGVSTVSIGKVLGFIPLTFPNPEKGYAYIEKFIQSDLISGIRVNFGTFSTSGKFAIWQSFGLIFLLYSLLFKKKNSVKKILYATSSALILTSIILALSRNAMLVSFVGIVSLIGVKLISIRKRTNVLLKRFIYAIIILLFIFALIFFFLELFDFFMGVRRGYSPRYDQLKLASNFLHSNWLLGIGPGIYALEDPKELDLHNTYMSIWVESGLISLIVFIVLLTYPAFLIFKFLKRNYNYTNLISSDIYSTALCMILVFVCSMIALFFFPGKLAHEIWLLIGLLSALVNIIRIEKSSVTERTNQKSAY